jgi:hypothetical protein
MSPPDVYHGSCTHVEYGCQQDVRQYLTNRGNQTSESQGTSDPMPEEVYR